MGCGGSKPATEQAAADFFGEGTQQPPRQTQGQTNQAPTATKPRSAPPPASGKKGGYAPPSGAPKVTKPKGDGVKSPKAKPFVAPPASTSFVKPVVGAATKSSPPKKAKQKAPNAPPKPVDPDDHSVAPSLDLEVREKSKKKFDEVYNRAKKLGYGAFAQVFIGKHKPTGVEYAIKQVDRAKMMWGDRDALKDEINNLKTLRAGPNIVQLHEVYEEKAYCFLVMELLPGGELFDRIIEKKTFSEKEARSATRCVLLALEYMHNRRVAHRDLKPENLLLAHKKELLPVKLADFGFAKHIARKNGCRTLCGTPGYLAPEILERWPSYDVKCDVWSIGVILFLLLGGYLPFDDENEDKVFDRTRNGQYDFRPQYWRNISSGAKDLVSQCLTINPSKRIDATTALKHDWMAVGEKELSGQVDVDKIKTLMAAKKKMKTALNTLVAANRLQQLNDDFTTYLDKRREESIVSSFSYMTGATRSTHATKFKEDSPSGKPFGNFYVLGEKLGEGGFSYVYRCTRKSTKETYAVKHVKRAKLDAGGTATLKDEISALKLLRGGPHIIRLYDVFQEPDNVYMILEELKGGNLLLRIVEKEVYTEREARQVCKILFQAIDYCHKKKIAHRDIKPENMLLVNPGDDTSVKIADFGFAKKVHSLYSLKTICGSAHYVAPEILDPSVPGYDQRADVWSMGIVSYVLLGGYAPFDGPLDQISAAIIRGKYQFHDAFWGTISRPAKAMIASMLQVKPENRISAEQALFCEWMALEEEVLTLRDLSIAKDKIKQSLKPGDKVEHAVNTIITPNKWMSLAGVTQDGASSKDPGSQLNKVEETKSEDFAQKFQFGEQIGIGTFSVVHEATDKETGKVYAVKRVPRKDLHPSDAVALHDEIASLKLVAECEHIVKLHEVCDEPDCTFLVLELMKGGDLIDRIIERRHYTEYDAKEVSRKLLMGVAYCHNKKIANRNLKPENLLLSAGSDTDVKISDFGYAKTVMFPNSLRTQCGTEGYVAPEILEHRPAYDVSCDIWSLGVIIYIVLGGYRPFRGEGEEVMKQIRYGEYKFHKRYWSHVSDDAKSLIAAMLTVDKDQRITAQDALKSSWIQADKATLGGDLSENMKDLKALRAAKAKFKGVVNTIIATNKLQSLGNNYRAFQDF